MPPNGNDGEEQLDQPPIDILMQDMEDVLQGRTYYTICCPSYRAHYKLFRWEVLKGCIIGAIFLTIVLEVMDMTVEASSRVKPRKGDQGRSFHKLIKDISNKEEGRKGEFTPVQEPQNWNSEKVTLDLKQDQGARVNPQVSPSRNHQMSDRAYAHRLFLRYLTAIVCCFIFSLIPQLFFMVQDTFLRHLVAVRRNHLLGGLFRFRRVARA